MRYTLLIIVFFQIQSAQAIKIPADSLNCENDTCYYGNKPFSGKIYRGTSFVKKYKKGLDHGTMKSWFFNSKQLQYKSKYKNGKLHGVSRTWNKEGTLILETPFKNGDTDGTMKEWFDDGTPNRWTSFKAHDSISLYFHGQEKDWNKEGVLLLSRNWLDNKLHGKFLRRYDNGQLKIETNYTEGRINGEYQEYFENGQLKIKATLEMGQELDIKYVYKEEGYLYKKVDYNTDTSYFYHSNGNLNGLGTMKGKKQEGIWKWYYENGNEIATFNYKAGVRLGEAIFYFEDGSVDRKVKFVDNKEVIIEK